MNSQLPLRPNVCMIVLNTHNLLFLAERLNSPGVWQFPQGGVEADCTLEDNVLRELKEELGAPRKCFQIIKRLNATNAYEFDKVPKYAVGKWRGQTQSFWLVRFLGNDSQIDINRYEAEFSAWRWCSLAEVRTMAEPKRLQGYEKALVEVASILESL